MANSTINEIDGEDLYDQPEELTVVGEISKSGRAPPVLIRLKDERQARLVLSRAEESVNHSGYGQEGEVVKGAS